MLMLMLERSWGAPRFLVCGLTGRTPIMIMIMIMTCVMLLLLLLLLKIINIIINIKLIIIITIIIITMFTFFISRLAGLLEQGGGDLLAVLVNLRSNVFVLHIYIYIYICILYYVSVYLSFSDFSVYL